MKKKLLCLTELVLSVLLALFFSGCGTVDEVDLSAFNGKNNITDVWATDIKEADTAELERPESVEAKEPETTADSEADSAEVGEPESVAPEGAESDENGGTESVEPEEPGSSAVEGLESDEAGEPESVAPEGAESPILPGNSRNRLEEKLADPEIQSLVEQWNNDEFTVELLCENGNILIYHFELIEQMDLTDDKLRELVIATMESELDKVASSFYVILDFFREEFEIADLTLRIEYFNADGSEILTRIFE